MGGQACVFYGAAQFSKDVDLALLASPENFSRLMAALDELNAKRIAVPPFEPETQSSRRPLLRLALAGTPEPLREALDAEARAEQAKDRAYWGPLKAELEAFRRAEREGA